MKSRDRRTFIEVKGVTLEHKGVCTFPDIPIERGLKHVRGLERCTKERYEAYMALVVQMKGMGVFTPNNTTHREFGLEMEIAESMGVRVLVCDCLITKDSMTVDSPLPHVYGH